jgi:hypothetical protein
MKKKEILNALINFKYPTNFMAKELRLIDWDDTESVVLTTNHIAKVLKRLSKGEISKEELTEWAELIECREDIIYDAKNEEQIKEIIFKIANPDLTKKNYLDHLLKKIDLFKT